MAARLLSEPNPIEAVAHNRRTPSSTAGPGFSATITPYDTILARAFALAESGRFASLAEGFVAVETALRGIHDRRLLRTLCQRATRGRAPD